MNYPPQDHSPDDVGDGSAQGASDPRSAAIAGEQLYTPALLAEILGLSVRVVRRWHRAGLLRSVTEVMQLPYFDFSQLATARRLSRWMQQGATVQSIERQLQLLRQRAGDDAVAELLTIEHLPITAEGKRLVLRSGDQFVEASGQLRFGFESKADSAAFELQPPTIPFQGKDSVRFAVGSSSWRPSEQASRSEDELGHNRSASQCDTTQSAMSLSQMVDEALVAEDVDDLVGAVDWYRAAMAAWGASANLCFQLAELLYRQGDLSGARERYFVALELDPNLVEARANLGCVLAEGGQTELAVSAFEGTLEQFADYADVHFHLARALDDTGQTNRAVEHWQRFLELAPASPWAEEAQQRLAQLSPLLEF